MLRRLTSINGGFVQSFATSSGIVATVTGEGHGGADDRQPELVRIGYRISKGWIADLFVNAIAGPQPVGNTLHGGAGLRITY